MSGTNGPNYSKKIACKFQFPANRLCVVMLTLSSSDSNKGDEEKEKNLSKMILTYVEAVKTVDPKICTGKLSGLWLALASVYEKQGDLENARFTMSKATEVTTCDRSKGVSFANLHVTVLIQVNYKTVDELANVWCAWGEMEMRHEEYEQALQIMQQAATEPAMSVRRRKARAVAQGKGTLLLQISAFLLYVYELLHWYQAWARVLYLYTIESFLCA